MVRLPASHIEPARVHALLGPTNTGKTHRAIERMLEFDTGMMGLPLRLLAREVYDRVTARLGEQAVALITGEEKRVPPAARYFICTVEAMPRDLAVDFLAIDEVQLVAHPERGHVFTERVLSWRGQRETWFLGAKAAERLLRGLLPELSIKLLPRLSKLSHIGQSSLRTLPRRSAVVAFNMQQVYELADALTARRGGAAVVLGALSPRVRNAQVALYQAGEVDFLVATDAIGMGLNLDIDHVALAGLRKFDGFENRELEPSELAQIVGRAGRYLRDGTFGTLAPEPELSPRLSEQLEEHRFAALRQAYYRNAQLDFASPALLLRSLAEKPPQRSGFTAAPDADDVLVLQVLAKRPEVLSRTGSAHAVRLLWDVCRIPNFEKRIPEHQAERLLPIFVALADRGVLAAEWVERELAKLARREGDLHQLMDRLSGVRTWTYVSHQNGWVERALELRARARAIEDELGDLLHERLRERFVRERKGRSHGQVPLSMPRDMANRPFAKLKAHPMYEASEREEEHAQQAWVEAMVDAPFEAFSWDARGELFYEGERVLRLEGGPRLLRPQLKLMLPEWVQAGARSRLERRLTAQLKDSLGDLLCPLAVPSDASAPLRGLFYQLEQGLGTRLRTQVSEQLDALTGEERALLDERHIVVGKRVVYAASMLTQSRRDLRMALCRASSADARAFDALFSAIRNELFWPNTYGRHWEPTLLALGMVPFSRLALRCDVLETLLGRVSHLAPEARESEIAALLSASNELARQLAKELGSKKRKRPRKKRKNRPTLVCDPV